MYSPSFHLPSAESGPDRLQLNLADKPRRKEKKEKKKSQTNLPWPNFLLFSIFPSYKSTSARLHTQRYLKALPKMD